MDIPEILGNSGSNDWIHDILILGIIVVILFIQIKVFFSAKSKIASYKRILPDVKSFQTEKIFLTEEEITSLSTDKILQNLDFFKNAKRGESPEKTFSEVSKNEKDKITSNEKNVVTDVKYFTSPSKGRFFVETSQDNAVYKLYNIWDGEADFEIILDANRIKAYFETPQLYLEKACDVINQIEGEISDVRVIEPGVAIFKDGVWQVSETCELEIVEE